MNATLASPLRGARIAVAETRELDLFAELLERRGAQVLRYPLVAIVDAPDPAPVLAWIERFNAGCDDLVLTTGEGLRRLLACIERHRPALRGDFLARLGRVRRIARGPKPGRVLRELGLKADLTADPATTEGLIAALAGQPLRGRRVGVQLYGRQPNDALMGFLRKAGADADPVWPYDYADASDDRRVLELIAALDGGAVDAIAFTSAAQIERLFAVAAANDRLSALHAGLARTVVAAVGPVVAGALQQRGVRIDAQPQGGYFLKPLAQALERALADRLNAATR